MGVEENHDEIRCKYNRQTVNCIDHIERYKKEDENYMKQYSSLYKKRFEDLSLILKEKLKSKWGNYD